MTGFSLRRGWVGLLTAATLLLGTAQAAEWYRWRGPFQTGVSPDKNLPASWSDDPKMPENFHWKAPYGCRSTPIVMHGRVYLDNQVGSGVNEQERVMCLDAKSGKLLWEKRFNVFHTDIVSIRLGWTNLAGDPETGNVYWHGTQGLLTCFDKDGNILWQHSLTEEYGRISGYGGRVNSPVLAGNLVVVGMLNTAWGDHAKGGNRFLAVDKKTGTPVWWSEPGGKPTNTYYSAPAYAVINNQELLISGGADGAVHAMQLHTGKHVWSYKFSSGAINSTPVVWGNLVYACSGEESPDNNIIGRIVCLDVGSGKPEKVWQEDGVKVKYTTPLLHDGRLYVADDAAKLWCFDARNGKIQWKFIYGRNGMASPVWGDGKIYLAEVDGKFHILDPGEKKCKRLHEHFFTNPDGVDVEVNASAAIADAKVFFSTRDETFCIGTKDGQSVKVGPELPRFKTGPPAQLQLIPCDVVLHPGDKVNFNARVFDADGHPLSIALKGEDLTWSLPQPPLPPGAKNQPPALQGEFDKSGNLTIKTAPPSQAGYVEATWKGLTARARVRIAPVLPYAQDFEKIPDGAAPGGWVNCQGKYVVKVLKDGNHVLAKVTNNSSPLIARGNCYLSTPHLTDYTIEADVYGTKVGSDMPDIGVVACRYTLLLAGNTQTVRLVSWEAMPRVDETVSFKWEPEKWYRMKLTARVSGGKTEVLGKVWPRGAKEPEKWTVTFTDPTPNRVGAPALYGYVLGHVDPQPGTDVYYDNVSITPNKK
jgi:outer membrane protein assembly factor BamB